MKSFSRKFREINFTKNLYFIPPIICIGITIRSNVYFRVLPKSTSDFRCYILELVIFSNNGFGLIDLFIQINEVIGYSFVASDKLIYKYFDNRFCINRSYGLILMGSFTNKIILRTANRRSISNKNNYHDTKIGFIENLLQLLYLVVYS